MGRLLQGFRPRRPCARCKQKFQGDVTRRHCALCILHWLVNRPMMALRVQKGQ